MKIFDLIKPLSDKKIWERRKFPRVEDVLRINYQRANDILHSNCLTKDISEGGLRLNLYQKMAIGSVLKLGIYLQDTEEPAWVIGKVAWTRETPGKDYPYEAGIEFYFFGPSFRSRIQDHIQSLTSQKSKDN
jgi:hypothetical protein